MGQRHKMISFGHHSGGECSGSQEATVRLGGMAELVAASVLTTQGRLGFLVEHVNYIAV